MTDSTNNVFRADDDLSSKDTVVIEETVCQTPQSAQVSPSGDTTAAENSQDDAQPTSDDMRPVKPHDSNAEDQDFFDEDTSSVTARIDPPQTMRDPDSKPSVYVEPSSEVHTIESDLFNQIYLEKGKRASEVALEAQKAAAQDAGSPEKYEVNVRHYANYKTAEEADVYADEMRDNLKYASKTPLGRFLGDMFMVLMRPGHFWAGQDSHPATITQICFPHLTVLIVARMVLTFIGNALQKDAHILAALLNAVLQAALIVIFIWGLSFSFAFVLIRTKHEFDMAKSFRFVSYSITPVLFIGILSCLPHPAIPIICDVLAMPYAFVVMGAGILPYLHVPEKSAPMITGLFCGLMACFWALLPLLLPLALPFMTSLFK